MKDRGEEAAARAGRIRALLVGALHREALLLSDREYDALAAEARRHGEALTRHALASLGAACASHLGAAARALGLPDAAIPRMLGLGLDQASALATLAGATGPGHVEAAHLGAIFNLGIALFDCICDRHPARAALLLDRVGPHALDAQLAGAPGASRRTGDPAVDVLLALIAEFFARAGRLDGGGPARAELGRVIRAMYEGERFAVVARRSEVAPSLAVLRALRRKSSLPLWTTAVLGHLACPREDAPLDALRATVTLAGDVLWIVDDLADVREDLAAGIWSRPLWILARAEGAEVLEGSAAAVIERLHASGIAEAEARRLAARLGRLRRVRDAGPLLRSLQVAVQSWVYGMPG